VAQGDQQTLSALVAALAAGTLPAEEFVHKVNELAHEAGDSAVADHPASSETERLELAAAKIKQL
jgi:hypothetical protein